VFVVWVCVPLCLLWFVLCGSHGPARRCVRGQPLPGGRQAGRAADPGRAGGRPDARGDGPRLPQGTLPQGRPHLPRHPAPPRPSPLPRGPLPPPDQLRPAPRPTVPAPPGPQSVLSPPPARRDRPPRRPAAL